jgi:hypothetical protein
MTTRQDKLCGKYEKAVLRMGNTRSGGGKLSCVWMGKVPSGHQHSVRPPVSPGSKKLSREKKRTRERTEDKKHEDY